MTARQHQTPSASTTPVAHFVPTKEHDSQEIWEALLKYRPVNVLPADWTRVKDFCRQAVLTYGPSNAKIAAEMLSTVTLFVLWATREEYAPLDYEGIFHPSLMGRYLRSRVSNKNSSAYKSLHSRLFRIAAAVADVDHNRRKRGRFAVPVHEYAAAELADLESWAGAHRTAERRQQARTVLALMGGAGLWTKEALAVREADVLTDADGCSIRVSGRNARVVPVLSDFAQYLDAPGTRSDGARFVLFPDGSSAESRAGSLKLLYRGAHPSPNPQWLRDTWMLRQLRALPASIVMEAAGMPDVTTLRRYLPNASLQYEMWESALRNPAAYGASMENTGDNFSAYGDDTWRTAYGKLRDDVASATVKLRDALGNPAVGVAATSETTGLDGNRAREAALAKLRDHVDPENDKLGDAQRVEGRPRPRDRARGANYERRPMSAARNEQTLATDSTAFPAGTPTAPFKRVEQAVSTDSTAFPAGTPTAPFKRIAASEPHVDGARELVNGEERAPRRIETLEVEWTPKRPRKKSRYAALPPSTPNLPAALEDLATAAPKSQTDVPASEFEVLRAALLAEVRRSARGDKR